MTKGVWIVAVVLTAISVQSRSAPSASTVIADIDLSKPFAAKSPWRFQALQGPDVPHLVYPGDTQPDVISFCLSKAKDAVCDPRFTTLPTLPFLKARDDYSDPHYLYASKVVHPGPVPSPPLLLVQTGSAHNVDGGHLIYTQLLAYRPDTDDFERVYGRATGSNHNEETRFIKAGPLRSDMISVENTDNAPFGYWVSVSARTASDAYKQILRYRSATHYADGNSLAVIDCEMPNIEQRLGLWRPGSHCRCPPARAQSRD